MIYWEEEDGLPPKVFEARERSNLGDEKHTVDMVLLINCPRWRLESSEEESIPSKLYKITVRLLFVVVKMARSPVALHQHFWERGTITEGIRNVFKEGDWLVHVIYMSMNSCQERDRETDAEKLKHLESIAKRLFYHI